jgi:hypothetical protein
MAGLLDKIRNTDSTDTAAPAEAAPVEAPPTADGAAPAAPAAPDVVVPDDASRLCANCAALLAEGQDWCLECGTSQPGSIGSRPGRRAVLTVLAVVALLAVGAGAAAYAALSSDPEPRTVAQAPPPAAPPAPAPAPVEPAPAPTDETPSVATPTDDGADDPAPSAGGGGGSASDDTTADTGAGTGAGSGSSGTGGGASTDTEDEATEKKKPVSPVIALSPDAASTFDPDARGTELTGDPADAIDGRTKTAWEAPVGDDGKVGLGLLLSLDQAKLVEKVRLRTETPGFSVELYGSTLGTAPEKAPGATKYWKKLDTTRDFGLNETLSAGGTYRHVLLWFTDQSATEKVLIPEVTLLKK